MSWTCLRCGAAFESPAPRCPIDAGTLIRTAELRSGSTLAGRYDVGELVGGGGHALVYRGRHRDAGREVAIKVLRVARAREPLMRERFLREARAANRIRHASVVDVTDVGTTEDGVPFLVMEFIDGGPLRAQLGEAWSARRASWLGAEIASALAAGHALGVVHRDLTPDNILLLEDERLKLVDFGVAKLDGERRLTATSVAVGTPRYMAPEQVRGTAVSDRSDVYSLACILFEALCGAPPFAGDGPEVMAAHVREPAPALPASVDPALAKLVHDGLSKTPSERPTAAAIVARLTGQESPGARSTSSVAPTRSTEADRLHERRALVVRLLDHIHADDEVPDTIACGVRDVARAISALRAERNERSVEAWKEERVTVERQIRAGLSERFDPIDQAAARKLTELGRLASRWLALDEAMLHPGDEPPSAIDAHAILDAVEAYIESHPDGMNLLPRRDPR